MIRYTPVRNVPYLKVVAITDKQTTNNMIRNLTISYYVDNVNVKLYTETDDDNIPYNLADIFARVVKDSNANEEILLEQLKDNLGL